MAVSSHSNAPAEPDPNALARSIEEMVKLHDFTLASAAEQVGAPLELIQLIYSRREVLNAQLQQAIRATTEGWQRTQLAHCRLHWAPLRSRCTVGVEQTVKRLAG